jgi:hypothetical protein
MSKSLIESGQPQPRPLDEEDHHLVDLVMDVLVDPTLHTDTRMRLQEEITRLLHTTHAEIPHIHQGRPTSPPAQHEHDPAGLLTSVLVDPNLHTDLRLRLHREIANAVNRTRAAQGSDQPA